MNFGVGSKGWIIMKFITRCGDSGRTMGVWGGRREGRAPWPWLGAGMGAGGVEPRLQPTRGGCQDPARDPQGSQGAPPGLARLADVRAWGGLEGPVWGLSARPWVWRWVWSSWERAGPGSAPPHPAPHPLLSPLSSPSTGEEWATACAP